MKNLFRVAVVCALVVPFTSVKSQITLDTNDVKANFAIGKTITQYTDTAVTSVNVGTPSPTVANSWNFTSLQTRAPLILTSISTAGAPGVGNFPGVTHCLRAPNVPFSFNIPNLGNITGTANLHQYFRVAGDLLAPGIFGPGTGLFNGSPIAGNFTTINTPTETFYKLPMTVGTNWTSGQTGFLVVDVTAPLPIPGAFRDTTRHNMRYVVDAFGTMTLPGGAQHQALRVRRIDLIRQNSTPERATLSFIFLAKNGAQVNFTACDTAARSGTIGLCGTTQWNGPFPTDVRLTENIPSSFDLKQNYPNPFNPSTTINYQVASEGPVSLKVYDLLGREVATLVNDLKSAGEYAAEWNAEGMPSGVYFYKMEAGNFSATRRLLLLK
jgi:hypothetical protein